MYEEKTPWIRCQIYKYTFIKINELCRKSIFSKNDLFAEADTLLEIMQPVGTKRKHNSHGLTPKEVFDVLRSLDDPYYIYKSKEPNRIVIVSLIFKENGEPIAIVIEVGSYLGANEHANINKMITMFPKSKLDKTIKAFKNELIYKK